MSRLREGEQTPESGVVLVPARSDPEPATEDGVKIGTRVVAAGFVLDLRADAIVEAMAAALLVHHHDAITRGLKPEGGSQRPLSRGRQDDPGRVSSFRGNRTGHLADNLRRSPITGSTAKAKTRILPPTDRNVFLATEAERGVTYLTTDGLAGEAACKAAAATVAMLAEGQAAEVNAGATTDVRAATDRSEAARKRTRRAIGG